MGYEYGGSLYRSERDALRAMAWGLCFGVWADDARAKEIALELVQKEERLFSASGSKLPREEAVERASARVVLDSLRVGDSSAERTLSEDGAARVVTLPRLHEAAHRLFVEVLGHAAQ